jgi:hypothetical protein
MAYIGTKPADKPLTAADIADGIITSAKIVDGTIVNADINASSAIALSKLSTTGTADATTFLRGDGAYTAVSAGITEADQWRVTANITADTNPISSNLERVDSSGQGILGTGMSVSSGTWTFPTTGIYLVRFSTSAFTAGADNVALVIYVTTNNSTYTDVAYAFGGQDSANDININLESLVDVTSVANVKVRFEVYSVSAGSGLFGSTTANRTYFTFIRLGDT